MAAAAASPSAASLALLEAHFGAAAKKLVEAARRPNTPGDVLQPLHAGVSRVVGRVKDEATRRALWAEAERSGLLQLCRERCAQTAAGRSSTGRSTRHAPNEAAWWRAILNMINKGANQSVEDAIDLIE